MNTKDVLTELRKTNGLTQDEIAEQLFVTRQAVSRWETGETIPNTETLKLISDTFKVSIDDLLGQPQQVCQSCAMTIQSFDDLGTESNGELNPEYCTHCYKEGGLTHNRTLEEMVETNLKFLDEFNEQNGSSYSEEEARTVLKMHLATLKRWQKA